MSDERTADESSVGDWTWRREDAPSARGLTSGEARGEVLGQLREIRDSAEGPAVRAFAAGLVESRGGEPRLRAEEVDGRS